MKAKSSDAIPEWRKSVDKLLENQSDDTKTFIIDHIDLIYDDSQYGVASISAELLTTILIHCLNLNKRDESEI